MSESEGGQRPGGAAAPVGSECTECTLYPSAPLLGRPRPQPPAWSAAPPGHWPPLAPLTLRHTGTPRGRGGAWTHPSTALVHGIHPSPAACSLDSLSVSRLQQLRRPFHPQSAHPLPIRACPISTPPDPTQPLQLCAHTLTALDLPQHHLSTHLSICPCISTSTLTLFKPHTLPFTPP